MRVVLPRIAEWYCRGVQGVLDLAGVTVAIPNIQSVRGLVRMVWLRQLELQRLDRFTVGELQLCYQKWSTALLEYPTALEPSDKYSLVVVFVFCHCVRLWGDGCAR